MAKCYENNRENDDLAECLPKASKPVIAYDKISVFRQEAER